MESRLESGLHRVKSGPRRDNRYYVVVNRAGRDKVLIEVGISRD